MRDISAVYRPGSFLTQAEWSEEEIRHGRPGSSRYGEFWYVYQVTLHEWCHHLQMIGSSFGHEYLLLTLGSGAGLCKRLSGVFESESMGSVARPLFASLLEYCGSRDDVARAIGLHTHLEILLGLRNEPELIFGNLSLPAKSPCPVVQANSRWVRLGALHIMEAHARCNEKLYAVNYSGLESGVLEEIFDAMSCDEFYERYEFPSDYVEEQTGLSGIVHARVFCLLCDVALNPPAPTSIQRNGGTFRWEDYHPGWRFVRATEVVRSESHRFDASEDEGLKELASLLYDKLSWPRDTHRKTLTGPMLSPFQQQVCRVRETMPLAFALPIQHFAQLQEEFPVSLRHYRAPEDSDVWFENIALNGSTQFEAARQVGAIFEKTVHELLLQSSVTCPWHGTRMPPATSCEERCLFPGFFRATLGITLSEYCQIPLADEVADGDISND